MGREEKWCSKVDLISCDKSVPYIHCHVHVVVLTILFNITSGFELSHCDEPGVPQFGFKVSDQGHFAGSAISYGCDQGYTLHGSGILKCMTGERRAWDNSLPSCIGKRITYLLSHFHFAGHL